jgi:hypothetical protein
LSGSTSIRPHAVVLSVAVEKTLSAAKAMHVILDNYAAHKHPKVVAWLPDTRCSCRSGA